MTAAVPAPPTCWRRVGPPEKATGVGGVEVYIVLGERLGDERRKRG